MTITLILQLYSVSGCDHVLLFFKKQANILWYKTSFSRICFLKIPGFSLVSPTRLCLSLLLWVQGLLAEGMSPSLTWVGRDIWSYLNTSENKDITQPQIFSVRTKLRADSLSSLGMNDHRKHLGLWKVTSESDKENIHLSTRGKTAIWNYFFTQGGKILHGISVGKNNGLFGKGKECIEKKKKSEMGSHTLESR